MATEIRLQKCLADGGVCSRRDAEQYILQGRVSVNGVQVRELGTKITRGIDEVCCDGKKIGFEKRKLYLFYKPPGVITTLEDPKKRPCLKEYVKDLPVRVFPVGRLDQDVSGLLLLTNDGLLANHLLHPRYEVKRTYFALVRGNPAANVLRQVVKGVALADGLGKALSVEKLKPSRRTIVLFGSIPTGASIVEIVVGEGRNHFVKNIFAAIGFPVLKLVRIAFGPYRLGKLAVGQMREVRLTEYLLLSKEKNRQEIVRRLP